MPLRGFIKTFPFRISYFTVFFFLAAFSIFWSFNPSLVSAQTCTGGYRWSGSQCRFYYGNTSGNCQSLPVADSFCSGGGSNACGDLENNRQCETANVPGSSGATNGCEEVSARYCFDGNCDPNHIPVNPTPTDILFDLSCSHTWSDANNKDLHMNIEFLDYSDGKWHGLRRSGLAVDSDLFKVLNNDESRRIPLRWMRESMQDVTTEKAIVFYPNCAGSLSDAMDADCYRKTKLAPLIVDNNTPSCTVSSVSNGSNYDVTITGNDVGSGIARMGLSYTPINSSGSPTGPEVVVVNNDYIVSPATSSHSRTFTVPKNLLTTGQGYIVTGKVWDLKGSNSYPANTSTPNHATCTTALQCIMPVEQVDFLTSCTPRVNSNGIQYTDSIVRARNLNAGGAYCQVDYVNVTENGTTSPDAGNFTYPNYWNRATNGAATLDIPNNFLKRDTGAELILQPNKRYWVSYYDQQSGGLTAGRSFVTRAACRAPTAGPTITAVPICKVDPHVSSDPGIALRDLRWSPLTSSQVGDNFTGYEIEVYRNSVTPANRVVVATSVPSQTSASFGAWYWEELQAGNTYLYRVRGESWGGYGPWSAVSSRYLIRKPSAIDSFSVYAYSSGQGVSGSPYITTQWAYDDATAPLRPTGTSYTWRNTTRGTSFNFASTQRSYTETLTYAQCNNTTYNYSLNAINECGTGPTRYLSFTCPANRAPTCLPIQYSDNNGASWVDYPPPPTSAPFLVRNPRSGILLRKNCTDTEGNSIRYDWSTSPGCGTFAPASQTLASPHLNGGLTAYTFPSNANMSCNLTIAVRDNLGHISPSETVIAKTFPAPNVGTHTISAGSRSIQRSSTTDAYAVVSGTAQDLATVNYNWSGYSNLSAQGSSNNIPGTARIDTTSTTVNGKINICHPTYGSCFFVNSGSTALTFLTASGSSPINIRLSATHQPTIRDVMVDPTTTNVKYGIRVNFTASAANGETLSVSPSGTPGIINNAPTCSGVTFGPTPGSPYRTGNISVSVTGRDDWGLRGLTITYRAVTGGTTTTVVNNPTQFNSRLGTATFNVSTTNMVSGYYNFNIAMSDGDGKSVNCLASGNITGDESGSSNTPPVILIDKQVPQCGIGGMTVTPNAAGDLLGFTVSGTDPTSNSSYSGLNRIHILAKRPNETAFSSTPVLSFNLTATPRPQNYTHTFSNASAATSYNLTGQPSGAYTFRAVWTDRAGNVSATPTSSTTPCDATYEKRSRITGKVNMFTGVDGLDKRDYSREVNGTEFSVGTRAALSQPLVPAFWQNATLSTCTATYPGVAGSSTCGAYFVSGAEYSGSAPPILELQFPRLSSDSGIGKYRCNMTLYNTVTSPWTVRRTVPNTDAAGSGATCTGTTCVCRFTLSGTDITVNPAASYSTTSIWPTHVEFDVLYNSDQVYGRVENEAGNAISGNTVTVSRGSWSSVPASVAGSYVAPAPSPDNTAAYARTNQSTNVTLNNADVTKLCVWAYRNNFVNPGANASRNSATTTFTNANVATVAQQLSLSGFNVGVSSQCIAPVTINSGPVSPKNQNQVNFLLLPKVQVTGTIYYLKNDNMCGEDWTDPDNQSTDTPLTVDMNFATVTPPPPNGALSLFYNPNNPSSPTGAGTYATGQTYTVYANGLPGSQWNNWQIQANVFVTGAGNVTYAPCEATTTIDVSDAISTYPSVAVIDRPIAVYMVESNDWWQTYNGGVHGYNSITNRVPTVDALNENTCGHDIHTVIGRGTCGMYASGTSTLRTPFRAYATGGLVTSRGVLQQSAGRDNLDWRITESSNWKDPEMKGLRLPFTTSESTDVTAVEKVAAVGTGENWKVNPGNLSTTISSSGNGKVFYSGDQTISSPLSFGNNNYMVVDGDLTINANLLASGSGTDLRQSIFIIASGDVTIGGAVSEVNAHIYTPGNITINSGTNGADDPAELPLKIYGGLYAGGNIDFRRDLPNINQNWGYPTTQVMFNPALVVRSRQPDFPSQLKETNVYWTQE